MAKFTIGVYDSRIYDELIRRSFAGEKLAKEENDYMSFCYHYEEYRTYGEVQEGRMNGEYIIDSYLDWYFRDEEESEEKCLDLSKNLSNTEKC